MRRVDSTLVTLKTAPVLPRHSCPYPVVMEGELNVFDALP